MTKGVEMFFIRGLFLFKNQIIGVPVYQKIVVSSLLFFFFFISCSQRPQHHVKYYFVRMDTFIQATLVQKKKKKIPRFEQIMDSILIDWQERFSQNKAGSELLPLNQRQESTVYVSEQLGEILEKALGYGDSTGGYFDITVLPLKELWGLGEVDTIKQVPQRDMLTKILKTIGYRGVHLHRQEKKIQFDQAATRVDIGGIAKGFVLREIGRRLDQEGVQNYLVEAGGDIVSMGERGDGRPWLIGIRHPRKPEGLLAILDLDSGAIVTSGDYERFWFTPEGRRVHHIFNPFTGYSCIRNQSVTIWGADPVELDIFSTGLFCREPEDILDFINARPRLQCMVIDSSGKRYVSEGWGKKIQWQD